jgi:transposase-like protein
VAEYGEGNDVEGIARKHGLTVEQVYALLQRQVGPSEQQFSSPPPPYPPPVYYGPPPGANYSAPPAYPGPGPAPQPAPGVVDDAIVAEYGEGHDVEVIARRHGISVDEVYEVVLRNVDDDDPDSPADPAPSW